MRLNDRALTIFTGMFLTIAVSSIAQYGDALMASFKGERDVHAVDDIYTIRQGTVQRLQVLLNDVRVSDVRPEDIRLTSQPSCGRIEQIGLAFAFMGNDSCLASTSFTYCISTGVICEPARVALRMPGADFAFQDNASEADTGLFGVARTETFDTQTRLNVADIGNAAVEIGQVAEAATPSSRFPVLPVPTSPADADRGGFTRPDDLRQASLAEGDFDGPAQPLGAPVAGVHDPAAEPVVLIGEASSPQGPGCAPVLKAAVRPGAMIQLDLRAQCHPMSRVHIVHEGLAFTMRTSALGNLRVAVPALNTSAAIAVRFDDGAAATMLVPVPETMRFERSAVSWTGGADFALHAKARGTEAGGPVPTTPPSGAGPAAAGRGGFLTHLGDGHGVGAKHAQVYSIATRDARRGGGVHLSVEMFANSETCGRQAVLRMATLTEGQLNPPSEIQLRLPDCGVDGSTIMADVLPPIAVATR